MFIPSIGFTVQIALILFSIVWIKTVVFRLSSDIAEVRETNDDMARYSIIAIWILTVVAILWLGQVLIGILPF